MEYLIFPIVIIIFILPILILEYHEVVIFRLKYGKYGEKLMNKFKPYHESNVNTIKLDIFINSNFTDNIEFKEFCNGLANVHLGYLYEYFKDKHEMLKGLKSDTAYKKKRIIESILESRNLL